MDDTVTHTWVLYTVGHPVCVENSINSIVIWRRLRQEAHLISNINMRIHS